MLKTLLTDTHSQKNTTEQAAENSTDGDMVTF